MDIHKTYNIKASRDAVWAALTDCDVIDRWGGGPCVMAAAPGSEFEFWGGDIHGTVLAAEPGVSMVQEWYGGDWERPSVARFTLEAQPNGTTKLELEHTGVPDAEAADFDAGWDDYYLGQLKAYLEECAS
jgi:uncharacterized protein YndB with AHSA1/START domain